MSDTSDLSDTSDKSCTNYARLVSDLFSAFLLCFFALLCSENARLRVGASRPPTCQAIALRRLKAIVP